ncbi:MAG: N-acetylmuramoyl-L-alanine amidase [Chthoniobacterales bacterium]
MGALSRARIWLGTTLVVGGLLLALLPVIPVSAQEEEEAAFSPAPTPSATKAKSKSAAATKKKSPGPSPKNTPSPKPSVSKSKKSVSEEEETPTPSPKKKSHSSGDEDSPAPSASAKKAKAKDDEETSATPKREAKKSSEEETPTPTAKSKKKKASEDEEASPSLKKTKSKNKKSQSKKKSTKAKGKQTPASDKTPKPAKTPAPDLPDAELPQPEQSPSASVPKAVPTTTPSGFLPPADITVQKSGLQQDEGFEPPPPPPPRRGFWNSLFGRREAAPVNYHYLSRDLIDVLRNAPVQRGRWKFIVVHNSGTRQGNARAFDYYHRNVRRMQNGLAYHFVIGNGTSSGNGQIEIGDRWRRQINGGHVHSDYLNNIALGICLVGDFNRDQPTRAQLDACEELIRYLQTRCGKSEGHFAVVRPHREVNPPRWATDCPGDAFPYVWFRRFRD